jgi:hypothetical protein
VCHSAVLSEKNDGSRTHNKCQALLIIVELENQSDRLRWLLFPKESFTVL